MKKRKNTAPAIMAIIAVFMFGTVLGAQIEAAVSKVKIRKAMNTHRAAHPTCEVCGARPTLLLTGVYPRFVSTNVSLPDFLIYSRRTNDRAIVLMPEKISAREMMETFGLEIAAKQHPVHHIKSQKPFPELAADADNLITLCVVHHYFLGHLRGHYKDHDANLLATIEAVKAAVASNAVSYNSTVVQ